VVSGAPGAEGKEPNQQQAVGLSPRRELARKGLHLLSAVIPVSYSLGVSRTFLLWALFAALGVAVAVELARARSQYARSLFEASVGTLLRQHERIALSGATWLISALFVTALVFPKHIAIAAMCAVSMGDAFAAIVGRAFNPRSAHDRKSLAGSVACFVVSAIAAYSLAEFSWTDASIAGVLAAVAERPRRPMDDNFRIALAVGCGILLWRMGFS
jgi:dolichol kinase